MRTRGEPRIGAWSAWLRRLQSSRHLTDLELAVLARPEELPSAAGAASAHAVRCAACSARIVETRALLTRMTGAAEAVFDAAISPPRLASQRRRILRRLERMAAGPCPARILRFPAVGPPTMRHAGTVQRWVAAAAVAGVMIGMALVQPGDMRRMRPEPEAAVAVAADTGSASRQSTLADEQLMRELEAALATRRVPPLVALDEMTPRLRAASTDIR